MNRKNSFYVKTSSKTIQLGDRFGYQFVVLFLKLFNITKAFLPFSVCSCFTSALCCVCQFSVGRARWVAVAEALAVVLQRQNQGGGTVPQLSFFCPNW